MPTVPAPVNTAPIPAKPTTPPPAPPQPISSSVPQRQRMSDGTIAAILFVTAALILCGLLGVFLYKSFSSTANTVTTPTIEALPPYTTATTVTIKGSADKNLPVRIESTLGTTVTKTDNNGKFSAIVTLKEEGAVSFTATTTKKSIFSTVTSAKSNEVSTIVDRTSPSMKVVTLPSTVSQPQYTVVGSISEKATVVITVNGEKTTAIVDDKNNFSATITFAKGSNSVSITAKDNAGNETATTPATVTYAVGTILTTGKVTATALPDSSGELSSALGTVFGRYIALTALALGILGFGASSSSVWILKQFRKQS